MARDYDEALAHAQDLTPAARVAMVRLLGSVMADRAERLKFLRHLRDKGRADWTEAGILRHGAVSLAALKSLSG